jgi:hypothetical protein
MLYIVKVYVWIPSRPLLYLVDQVCRFRVISAQSLKRRQVDATKARNVVPSFPVPRPPCLTAFMPMKIDGWSRRIRVAR